MRYDRCILELHAISNKINESGGRFEITMPSHSKESFLRATSADQSRYFSLLSNVDAEHSHCSRETDEKNIHDAITGTIGFDGLNRSIYSVISNWIIGQLQTLSIDMKCGVRADAFAGILRSKALGTVLCAMGRYDEALRVFQGASKTYASFENAAPVLCGTQVNSADTESNRQIIRIYVHLGQYDLAQKLYDDMARRKGAYNDSVTNMLLESEGITKILIDMAQGTGFLPDLLHSIDHLVLYHRLIFADADDPEFMQAFGCNEVELGGKLKDVLRDPHLFLILKKIAFEIKIDRLPGKHPSVALAMLQLAHAHFEVDQCDEALPLLQRALPFLRRLPLCHPNIILALLLSSACLLKHGELPRATSAAQEAHSMCTTHHALKIPIPAEIAGAAEAAAHMCCDPDFQLNFSSPNADVRSGCVLQFAAVIKSIGTDEARMERVIINRSRDASARIMQKIMPEFQAKMDARMQAEGWPSIDW